MNLTRYGPAFVNVTIAVQNESESGNVTNAQECHAAKTGNTGNHHQP